MTWTLTGRFARPDGTPAHGRVLISTTPAVLEDDTGDVVYASPVELILDAEGRIPDNELPFSDDPRFAEPPVYRLDVGLSHRTLTPLEGVQVDTGTDSVDYADLARSILGPTVREQLAALGLRVDGLDQAAADLDQRLDDHAADPTAHTIPTQIAEAVAIIDGGTL